ncbi:MAG: HAMP domain-containing protein [Oleispira sp.]|jgi:HAMP domain-containing protein
MKSTTSIAGIVRRATFIVFTFALIVGSATFYLFFNAASMRHVEDEARALLGLAMASRNYTIENITPLLVGLPNDVFHPERVPSFAAQAIFRRFVSDESDYTYREAALNPTNPDDLATGFETLLIAEFRTNRLMTEAKGIRRVNDEPIFYIARPVVIKKIACLACHSTPDAAPAEMVAIYGDVNGFGWKLNEVVGVQVLTIPVAEELRSIYELVAIFFVMLIAIFFVVSLMVTLPLQRNVIQPLRQLANVADRSSLRNDETPLPKEGAGEIQTLSAAISRMRTSLNVSSKKMGDPD